MCDLPDSIPPIHIHLVSLLDAATKFSHDSPCQNNRCADIWSLPFLLLFTTQKDISDLLLHWLINWYPLKSIRKSRETRIAIFTPCYTQITIAKRIWFPVSLALGRLHVFDNIPKMPLTTSIAERRNAIVRKSLDKAWVCHKSYTWRYWCRCVGACWRRENQSNLRS